MLPITMIIVGPAVNQYCILRQRCKVLFSSQPAKRTPQEISGWSCSKPLISFVAGRLSISVFQRSNSKRDMTRGDLTTAGGADWLGQVGKGTKWKNHMDCWSSQAEKSNQEGLTFLPMNTKYDEGLEYHCRPDRATELSFLHQPATANKERGAKGK